MTNCESAPRNYKHIHIIVFVTLYSYVSLMDIERDIYASTSIFFFILNSLSDKIVLCSISLIRNIFRELINI